MIYVFICTRTTPDVVVPLHARNQDDQNRRMANALKAKGGLNAGDLKLRPNGNAVANHLLCDGSAVAVSSFPQLYDVIGNDFGGDGVTFNLPDYMGQALAVADTGVQTITETGTVEGPIPVTEPTESGQVGGTDGGNVISGGRARFAEIP